MFIVDIIPLTNLPITNPQVLSYYSMSDLPTGAVVEIMLGNQKLNGIVYKTVPLTQRKALLKKVDFSLKKIQKIIYPHKLIPDYLISLANFISQYYFASLSLSLKIISPPNLSKFITELVKMNPHFVAPFINIDINNANYQSKISNSFQECLDCFNQSDGQILILTPTNFHEKYFFELLHKTFNNRVIRYQRHSKSLAMIWHKIFSQNDAIIIGNRSAVFLPFNNLKNIFVINPDNISYKSFNQKPYYHCLNILTKISLYYHAPVTYYYHY